MVLFQFKKILITASATRATRTIGVTLMMRILKLIPIVGRLISDLTKAILVSHISMKEGMLVKRKLKFQEYYVDENTATF